MLLIFTVALNKTKQRNYSQAYHHQSLEAMIVMPLVAVGTVTGQLADCQLADWTTRGLDNSRTGQVADWTTRGCHRRLCVLSFPFWRHLRDRELSSPRVDQSARCPVRESSSPRVGNPRVVQ